MERLPLLPFLAMSFADILSNIAESTSHGYAVTVGHHHGHPSGIRFCEVSYGQLYHYPLSVRVYESPITDDFGTFKREFRLGNSRSGSTESRETFMGEVQEDIKYNPTAWTDSQIEAIAVLEGEGFLTVLDIATVKGWIIESLKDRGLDPGPEQRYLAPPTKVELTKTGYESDCGFVPPIDADVLRAFEGQSD